MGRSNIWKIHGQYSPTLSLSEIDDITTNFRVKEFLRTILDNDGRKSVDLLKVKSKRNRKREKFCNLSWNPRQKCNVVKSKTSCKCHS